MANDKNTINELVAEDDDTTAELEMLAATYDFIGRKREAAAPSITELESDLKNRSETIDRLQFDIEQLRAKWAGLEVEIKAREDLTKDLNQKLGDAREKLARKKKLLKKREQQIERLKKEVREDRDTETASEQPGDQRQSGSLASARTEVRELRAQLERMESYADDIRRKLQERSSLTEHAESTRESLQDRLNRVTLKVRQLEGELEEARALSENLAKELVSTRESHAEEIRMIRFELGEAQETVTEHILVTEQLASDLVDTREFRDKLERTLNETEEQTQLRIEELERENRKLRDDLAHNEEQLESKNEALNCLLAELAKKSQEIESIDEIEDVIHEIDDRMSERFDDRARKERDRVTRVLIGSVDGQEVRFPLFKDRLTIGRTDQNDIKLQASCVSRRHAVIVSDPDATRIVDWGSKNGVFVNSKRITEHFLRNGDNLTIGTAKFRYEERPKRDN